MGEGLFDVSEQHECHNALLFSVYGTVDFYLKRVMPFCRIYVFAIVSTCGKSFVNPKILSEIQLYVVLVSLYNMITHLTGKQLKTENVTLILPC